MRTPAVTGIGRCVLIGIELIVAAGAAYAGVGLIVDNELGMAPHWLERTPFDTWTLPGVFLLLIVAVPMLVALVAERRRSPLAYAVAGCRRGVRVMVGRLGDLEIVVTIEARSGQGG
jgi:hypothetical protein